MVQRIRILVKDTRTQETYVSHIKLDDAGNISQAEKVALTSAGYLIEKVLDQGKVQP
ncbi:hypothetical protein [Deinococcus roseus]|uniref:Uncharacterized protein n=1 Tax=Deinococcus roseus TaxID=392414 RepID=A0ABQ2DGV5_9DEIO|nr:hypothetical protein [Deinococcus roseus]GGJ55770.1 hypothetical protein GCM10008938_47450 [Deinococcus roseus]